MRTADDTPVPRPEDVPAQLGDGYSGGVTPEELTDGYGDSFDDDYDDHVAGDGSGLDETLDDLGLDEGDVDELSESEAEAVLVEAVGREGFSSEAAADVVDDVQADSGLTATELLEDLVDGGDSLRDGDDGGLGFAARSASDAAGTDGADSQGAFDFDFDLDG